jgi:glutathione S-transferase
MKLYYSPMACSLSDHIALEEAGVPYEAERVDLHAKRTASGQDFMKISPKGYVPVLELDTGETLTENAAVLDWIASQNPKLSVGGPLGRSRVLEALSYISSELHHAFRPLWHPADEAEKVKAGETILRLLQLFETSLQGDFLFGEEPSVADFYLFVILLWATRADLALPPNLAALRDRMGARPAVQAAMRAEDLLSDPLDASAVTVSA